MGKPGVDFYYEAWPNVNLTETLNTLDSLMIRLVEGVLIHGHNRVRMLTFLQPFPAFSTLSPGVVMIIAREDTILPMMRSVSRQRIRGLLYF